MNKIYKVVWSKVKNCYVVVSEIAKNVITGSVKSAKIGSTPMTKGLALGAVMAFVITGNVWAADISQETVIGGIGNQDNIPAGATTDGNWTLNGHKLSINNEALYGYAVWANGYSFTGVDGDGSTLEIKADDGDPKLTYGLGVNGTVNVDNLIIEAQDQAIYAAAKTDITAKNIGISANGGWAVYTEPNANVVAGITAKETANIQGSIYANFAKSVTVDAGKLNMLGYVYNYGSNVTVGLGTEGSLTGKVISAYDGTTTIDMGTNSTWNVTDDSTVTGLAGENAQINKAQTQKATTDNTTVTVNNANADTTNVVLKDTSLEFTDVDLIVNSDRVSKDKYGDLTPDTTGMLANTTIKSNSGVVINQTGNNAALGYLTKTNIEADSIKVTAEGQGAWAVYNVYNTDEHILKANEIELASKGRTVFSQDGNIKITADKLKVTSDRSAEEKKNSAITVNSTGKVNVNADEVVLVGGIDLIGADTAEVNFKSADESATPQTMQITGDINAKKGKLTGLSLDGEESFIKGAINTAGNTNAAVTFSNGATWIANAESAVQKFGGQDGVIVVDEAILGTAGAVTIADNTSTGTVVKAKNISLAGGAKKALSGLEEKLQSTVTATGTALTYQAAVLDTELRGDVEFKDGKVITTMDTDTLIAREDVKAGDVSLVATAQGVKDNADAIVLKANAADVYTQEEINEFRTEANEKFTTELNKKVDKNAKHVVIGESAKVHNTDGYASVSIGKNAQSNGMNATVIGGNARVTGGAGSAVALGMNANVDGAAYGVAVGAGTKVTSENSVALGANSVADKANVVSVGKVGKERKIVNVKAGEIGEDSTEAVVGGQLFATNNRVEVLEGKTEGIVRNAATAETKVTDDFVVDTATGKGKVTIGYIGTDEMLFTTNDEGKYTFGVNAQTGEMQVNGGAEFGKKADGTYNVEINDEGVAIQSGMSVAGGKFDVSDTGKVTATNGMKVQTTGKGNVVVGDINGNTMLYTTGENGYVFGVEANTGNIETKGTLRVANDHFVVDTLGNTAIKGSLSVDKDVKVSGGLEAGTNVIAADDVYADNGNISLKDTAAAIGTAATDISELEAKTAGISRTQYSGTTTGETKVTDDFVVDTVEGNGKVTIGYIGEDEMIFTTDKDGKYTFGVNAQTGEMQVNGGAEFGKKADGTYNVEINDEGVAVQSGLSVAGGKFDVSDTGKVTASNGMKVQTSGEGSFSFANIGTDETLFYAMSTDSSKTNPTIVMNAQNGNIETQGSLSVGNGAFVSDAASGNAAVKGSLAVGSDANVAGGVNVETNVIAKGDVFAGEGEKQVSLKETAKQVAVQGDKITALENASSEQSNKIGALENLTTEHSNKIGALEDLTSEHSNKIGALEDLTSEHSNKIGALENLTAEQGNKITALENSDKEQSNKITALENATGEQSGKITALENASAEQAGKITALENDSAEQSGKITALEGLTSEHTDKITALENDSAEQSGKITALENSDAVQNTAIAKNSEAISGLNQRLGKMNGKVNKVGAGAAALAALHPLEYDPDDKLTFSAGVGNYNGENAAALGAFYRPDEKLMFSLGGTMGNGENMVNLGVSIGLDGAKGGAKLSKKELIQKVSTMEAENAAIKAENDALEDRVAKLEALVAKLAEK